MVLFVIWYLQCQIDVHEEIHEQHEADDCCREANAAVACLVDQCFVLLHVDIIYLLEGISPCSAYSL